jgi:hypothetical protein
MLRFFCRKFGNSVKLQKCLSCLSTPSEGGAATLGPKGISPNHCLGRHDNQNNGLVFDTRAGSYSLARSS